MWIFSYKIFPTQQARSYRIKPIKAFWRKVSMGSKWEVKTSESLENLRRRQSLDHNFLTFISVKDHFIVGMAKKLSITKLCLSFFLFLFWCMTMKSDNRNENFCCDLIKLLKSSLKVSWIKFLVSINSIMPSFTACDVNLQNMLML